MYPLYCIICISTTCVSICTCSFIVFAILYTYDIFILYYLFYIIVYLCIHMYMLIYSICYFIPMIFLFYTIYFISLYIYVFIYLIFTLYINCIIIACSTFMIYMYICTFKDYN